MRERNHSKREPGAEVYGSPSIFHAPFGARNSPKFSLALPPTPAPRWGASYGHINILKSFSGMMLGPASRSAQFKPPSVRIFAAIPPPAPEPMMQTSYCFGERITWAIADISPGGECYQFSVVSSKKEKNCLEGFWESTPCSKIVFLHFGDREIAGARRQGHVREGR